jgi:cobalt-zinc-cadmium efflux system membrane fusion protein
MTSHPPSESVPKRRTAIGLAWQPAALLLLAGGILGAASYYAFLRIRSTASPDTQQTSSKQKDAPASTTGSQNATGDSQPIVLVPAAQWTKLGLAKSPAVKKPFQKSVQLTGKVSLNEDRIAHIYPMVEGAVEDVYVGLGQKVKANELLVMIHSREIGLAKLELYQARLQWEMAKVKENLQREISQNTKELLTSLRDRKPIQDIESLFRSRGMGDYRERLLLAYSSFLKSQSDVQRLEGVSDSGAISAKQLVAAQSSRNADLATFQSRIEQVEFELKTSLLLASQAAMEAGTRVSVATTNLRILGCDEKDIVSIDPERQGQAISDYPIRAPFDGTVISKDAALKEQVRPSSQILSIADLSNVWIAADVYEQNVPLLNSLAGQTLTVRNEAWPDRTFEAKIFYTGDIMDDATRTISMRAIADNPEQLLKPGMFVQIELPGLIEESVLQVPKSAVLEHEGKQFVFVQTKDDAFMRRDVSVGEAGKEEIIVLVGLQEGEEVVTSGGFVLKSKLLSDLMGEE